MLTVVDGWWLMQVGGRHASHGLGVEPGWCEPGGVAAAGAAPAGPGPGRLPRLRGRGAGRRRRRGGVVALRTATRKRQRLLGELNRPRLAYGCLLLWLPAPPAGLGGRGRGMHSSCSSQHQQQLGRKQRGTTAAAAAAACGACWHRWHWCGWWSCGAAAVGPMASVPLVTAADRPAQVLQRRRSGRHHEE